MAVSQWSPTTNPVAGSKGQRTNIHGHVVVGSAADLLRFRRLSVHLLGHIFRQAAEQGQARVALDDEVFTLHRRPDHTFALEAGEYGRMSL